MFSVQSLSKNSETWQTCSSPLMKMLLNNERTDHRDSVRVCGAELWSSNADYFVIIPSYINIPKAISAMMRAVIVYLAFAATGTRLRSQLSRRQSWRRERNEPPLVPYSNDGRYRGRLLLGPDWTVDMHEDSQHTCVFRELITDKKAGHRERDTQMLCYGDLPLCSRC
jgi:hypothetical protein